jgi:predicted Zn-dependent peptidase
MKSAIGDVDPLRPFTQSLLVRKKEITQMMSYYDCLRLTSVFSLMGACRPGDEDQATKGAIEALGAATWTIQPDTLHAAKLQVKCSLAKALSDTRTLTEELALHLLNWGNWRTLEEWGMMIDAVTVDDIKSAVQASFGMAGNSPVTIITFLPKSPKTASKT